MEQFAYPIKLTKAVEGGYVVTCRDLPALVTQGEDKADALVQATDAMDEFRHDDEARRRLSGGKHL